ncbi:hypothetical protein AB1Y20_012269 [Prymnesium parvum]|uniref:Methyltransferase FkbM domain-containing protein n=1 Tax=Prymnesium parvum TaxID=97485 RepID=A0AB34IQX2_PRYPA
MDADIARFLSTFTAASPVWTSKCRDIIAGTSPSPAQHSQDVFAWRNLFLPLSLRGERGVYVDAGASEPFHGSTTWFYDKCLGWRGLCVEPSPKYAAALRRERSCEVVPACLSSADGLSLPMARSGPFSRVGGKGRFVTNVTCHSVRGVLARAGVAEVHFWSLDVEGHEMAVLDTAWESAVRIHAVLVEDDQLDLPVLDQLMARKGYQPAARFWADSLYTLQQSKWHGQPWCPAPSAVRGDGYTRGMFRKKHNKLREHKLTCPSDERKRSPSTEELRAMI